MFRKLAFYMGVAAALGLSAASTASAHGSHGGSFGGLFHGSHGGHGSHGSSGGSGGCNCDCGCGGESAESEDNDRDEHHGASRGPDRDDRAMEPPRVRDEGREGYRDEVRVREG